jgi:mono/diheme cytochrome c family protein
MKGAILRRSSFAFAALVALGLGAGAHANDIPPMDQAMLTDPERIEAGRAFWEEQCRHCHGRDAYPGKAPKLNPRRYSPEFVYHRITFGFRGMPAWEGIYSQEERIDMVAYILSGEFSP